MRFQNGYYYHIYNRGVDKREVFLENKDYIRFLTCLREFNSVEPIRSLKELQESRARKTFNVREPDVKRLTSIIAYCLNPNHFHLLLKQLTDGGVSEFMKRLGGYTKYFNLKYKRSGSLFQGTFKVTPLKTEGKLLSKSLYVNGNYEIHGLGKAENWPWSSCPDYLGARSGNLCDKNEILNDFSNPKEYGNLLADYIKDKKEWREEIKTLEG